MAFYNFFDSLSEREDYQESRDFNVCILVDEIRDLPFSHLQWLVGIEVGHLKRFTRVAGASSKPFFNEYFVFEFNKTPNEIKELTITLTVYYIKNQLHVKKILGSARLDVGTVWAQPGHEINSKWVVLTDLNDPIGKTCGHLKLSVRIVGDRNQVARVPSHKNPSHDELKKNLLVPENLDGKSQGKYSVTIYYAEDLRKWQSAYRPNKLSKYGYDKNKSFRSYVKVSFGGLTAATSRKKDTRSPVWNEKLTFYETFPPMYNRLKIELIVGKYTAVKYIDLSDISDSGIKGYLPTYGPSYLHFYKFSHHFVGSLLVSLSAQTFGAYQEGEKLRCVKKNTCEPLPKTHFKHEEFLLVGIVYGVSMLSDRYTSNKDLWLTMSFGGLEPTTNVSESFSLKTQNYRATKMSEDDIYNYLAIGKSKPCFFLKRSLPDFRHRCYNSNRIEAIARTFRKNLRAVLALKDKGEIKAANNLIIRALQIFKEQCQNESRLTKPGDTKLDTQRSQTVSKKLESIVSQITNISPKATLTVRFEKALDLVEKIFTIIEDPQESYPNILVCLWNDDRMISYCVTKTKDIIYSPNNLERGHECGKVHSAMFKNIGKAGFDFAGKMDIFLWFGPYSAIGYCLQSLPSGHVGLDNVIRFPNEIEYVSHLEFIFKAYISNGYLEPFGTPQGYFNSFVKVIIANKSARTSTVQKSINPIWKETVKFDIAIEFGTYLFVKDNPPLVVCEIWDEGEDGNRIIGRCSARPYIFLMNASENYSPQLHWYKILSKEKSFGEILAMFELIEPTETKQESDIDEPSLHPKLETSLNNPDYAYPHARTYRLEVLFWGIQQSKLMKPEIKNPQITIACSQALLSSEILKNNLNFCEKPKFAQIEVDDIKAYAPPLIIRVYECKNFGVVSFVGCHIIKNIQQFSVELLPESIWTNIATKNAELLKKVPKALKEVGNTLAKSEITENTQLNRSKSDNGVVDTSQSYDGINDFVRIDMPPLMDEKYDLEFTSTSGIKKLKTMKAKLLKRSNHQTDSQNPYEEEKCFDWWSKYYHSLEIYSEMLNAPQTYKLKTDIKKLTLGKMPTIKIYPKELEKVDEFEGFTDSIKTFDLIHSVYKYPTKKKCTAKLKAAICICPWPSPNTLTRTGANPVDGVFNELSKRAGIVENIVIRVYVVRGHNIYSCDKKSAASSFIAVSVNSKSIVDSKHYIAQDSNPVFGRCYELQANLPFDSVLTIKMMEFDQFGAHDIIGETKIDIENRFFSRHRGSCGISSDYNVTGCNKWRDVQKPSEILVELCHQYNLEEPKYIGNVLVVGAIKVHSQNGVDVKEHLALKALNMWHTVPGIGLHIVPEHVEMRTLYHPDKPDIESGKLEMWVDILPQKEAPLPPQVDIKPRKPEDFVLRVIVWKTSKIELVDESLLIGKKHGDILIKGWLLGNDRQQTDVHFVCTTGDALFNWRFIFPFPYIKAEKLMVLNKKAMKQLVEIKKPPILHIEAWDYDRFSLNEYIGSLELDLGNIPKSTNKTIWVYTNLVKRRRGSTNLFKVKNIRGWWPLTKKTEKGQEKFVGLIDLEMELLTKNEAEYSPAGHGRNEPLSLPFPDRPVVKKSVWMVPFRAINRFLFRRNKMKIIRCLFIVGLILFIAIFFYSFPQYSAKLLLGA